jgi:hypothetical protein
MFNTQITTEFEAKQFLTTMQVLFPLLHPESDPCDYYDKDTNKPWFSQEQCEYIEDRFEECYEILPDPCDFILTEVRPKMSQFMTPSKPDVQATIDDLNQYLEGNVTAKGLQDTLQDLLTKF